MRIAVVFDVAPSCGPWAFNRAAERLQLTPPESRRSLSYVPASTHESNPDARLDHSPLPAGRGVEGCDERDFNRVIWLPDALKVT